MPCSRHKAGTGVTALCLLEDVQYLTVGISEFFHRESPAFTLRENSTSEHRYFLGGIPLFLFLNGQKFLNKVVEGLLFLTDRISSRALLGMALVFPSCELRMSYKMSIFEESEVSFER